VARLSLCLFSAAGSWGIMVSSFTVFEFVAVPSGEQTKASASGLL